MAGYIPIYNMCNVIEVHVNNTTHLSIKAITTQQKHRIMFHCTTWLQIILIVWNKSINLNSLEIVSISYIFKYELYSWDANKSLLVLHYL